MTCPSCGRENRPGARFCGGCGASLAPRCPRCGVPVEPGNRFCDACGAPLAGEPAEKAIARKVVTVVFADLKGSMALHERRDAESARRLTDRYHRAMTAAVEVHGGRVIQLLGDGVLAAFGVPRVAEDDAIRAVRAAVGMQRAFRELAREQGAAMEGIGLRVAVNTGEVVTSDDETAVIGDATNVAARLQHEAGEGEVIIGEATQRLVGELVTLAPLGSFALRGREEAVGAYRVVSLERPARSQALAFVGRDDELRRLLVVYDAACAAPGARLAVLLGSPGLGKSRLLGELARKAGERANVLAARCDQTPGATFAPLAEALRGFLGIEEGAGRERLGAAIDALVPGSDAERARITAGIAALLSGEPSPPEETFFVVRRFLAALAAVRPVVLAIDDLHWAEPLLLDLVEHLVQWSAGVPLLLVGAARPELRDARSSLVTPGPLVADVVTLAGLEAGSAMRLAANVIGASELPAALAGRVLATSEGNPLFVAELVRMLVQDGTLRREGERWVTTVELADLEMPPTIQVLLAARIERLRPEERAVLERAAVVGRHFSRAAVAHLLGRDAGALDARLEAMRRSELIEPDSSWFLGEPGLRFHHVLIRDAAYRRLLRETRAELHERFADWVAARAGESVEHDETIGFHLEQAHENLRALGPLDARGRSLGERAARHLGDAGRRALARDDVSLAAGLLGRALGCLEADHPARADLALDWCEALLSEGDVAHAQRAVAELGRLAGDSERLRAWHTCFRGQLAALTDPGALRTTAGEVAAAAQALAALADAAGEAKAHSVHAGALQRLGEIGACESALDRALAAARRAGDRRRANAAMTGAPLAALWGPTPVTRASGRCLDVVRVLRITQSAPAVEAVALRCQALLEELRGRGDAARRMIASSRHMVEELGVAQQMFEADVFAGHIELLEGDAVAAERFLRSAYDGLRERGLGIDAARAGALLGKALLAQDRAAEAEALSHESEALAGDDLKAAMGWRGVRAEALARRGEHASAIELAHAAVEIAARTDNLLDHADARVSLAAALRAAGRSADADTEKRRAVELWEQKGATLLVERARSGAAATGRPRATIASPRAFRRSVPSNYATRHLARIDEAVAARDARAVEWLLGETRAEDHTSGRSWSTYSLLASFRWMIERDEGLAYGNEPIAALGPSLALARWREISSHVAGRDLPIGPFELDGIVLVQAGPDERSTHVEIFDADQLGAAVTRLYERYAELLPEGPERERAAAVARSAAALVGPADRWRAGGAPFAPDVEARDQRTVGFGSLRGAAAVLEAVENLRALSDDLADDFDDVLELRPNALLVRATTRGVIRATGGAYEQKLCQLVIFGPDGRIMRWEQFDAEQEAEARVRFDALMAEPPFARRRVRSNAATRHLGRIDEAFAARDLPALEELLREMSVLDHASGRSHASLDLFRWMIERGGDWALRHEPIAVLGPSLALARWREFGTAAADLGIGEFDLEGTLLVETDGGARLARGEVFAAEHIGDAVVRLFERYAELLPQGPESARAAVTARAIAANSGPIDFERLAAAFAHDIEFVDRRPIGLPSARGARALLRFVGSLLQSAPDSANRIDDVLALRPDALLTRITNTGTDLATGGPFERCLLRLVTFGDDGRVTRLEQFDAERADEALVRFDELAREQPRAVRRRVRANRVTESAARYGTALAARGLDAVAESHAADVEAVIHTTGVVLDRQEILEWWRLYLADGDAEFRLEPLATLGNSLGLFLQTWSGVAGGGAEHAFGAFEADAFSLHERDREGRLRRIEEYALGRLGDAIARLYARHAELLPDGSERERARTTARVMGIQLLVDDGSYDGLIASDVAFVDHRRLGIGRSRGVARFLRSHQAQRELADRLEVRVRDILAQQPDAILTSWTTSGTERRGGGVFERDLLMLWTYAPDGRLARVEWFDPDRRADALARLEELTAKRPASSPRRVRANAATANAARLDAVIAAREPEGLAPLFADAMETVDHRTAVTWDRAGSLAVWRGLMRVRELRLEQHPLATLGGSLGLFHQSYAGVAGGKLDAGAFESEQVVLLEVDADGRRSYAELFPLRQLGGAIARLYARYAARLSDDAARARAETTARYVAILLGEDVAMNRDLLSPNLEFVDHRPLGLGRVRGVEGFVRGVRIGQELEQDVAARVHEILDLRPGAALMRCTISGTGRVSGGTFDRDVIRLWSFAEDGRLAREEWFDPGRDAEAFARLDELGAASASPVRRRVRANLLTAHMSRAQAAFAAGDLEAIDDLHCPDVQIVLHGMATAVTKAQAREYWRQVFAERDVATRFEVLATLGPAVGLIRHSWSGASGADSSLDVVAYQAELLSLEEAAPHGRLERIETFAPDRLSNALTRMYQRYAERMPLGAERQRAEAIARAVAACNAPPDLDRYASALAASFECIDHRSLATWSARGPDEWLRHWRTESELAESLDVRDEDVLALEPDAFLVRRTYLGSDRAGGGRYENSILALFVFGPDGLRRAEAFDPDRDAEALARFEELVAEPPRQRFENAATRANDEFMRCQNARDWRGIVATQSPDVRMIDRRSLLASDLVGRESLENLRVIFDMGFSRWRSAVFATRGERLALARSRGETEGGGAEVEFLALIEVDAGGKVVVLVTFDPDALDAAYEELDARYAAGEAAPFAELLPFYTQCLDAFGAPDPAALERLLPHDFRSVSHAPLRLYPSPMSRAEAISSLSAAREMGVRGRVRCDHLRVSARAFLADLRWIGTRDGVDFEIPDLLVGTHDGRVCHAWELFDSVSQVDRAFARFEELSREALASARIARIENAATRGGEEFVRCQNARDWDGVVATLSPAVRVVDRRSLLRNEVAGRDVVENFRIIFDMGFGHWTGEMLATRGEHLALVRGSGQTEDPGGPLVEHVSVIEVDESGRLGVLVSFDPDDLDAAYEELEARYDAGEAAPYAKVREPLRRLRRARVARDWEQMASVFAPGFVAEDHRPVGAMTLRSGAEYVASVRALLELAPDAVLRSYHVLGLNERASLGVTGWSGTREGGAFETTAVTVQAVGPDGRIERMDIYDLDQLPLARARFEELRPDPLRIPPNAASRARDRMFEAAGARDWARLRALASDSFEFDDRGRAALLRVGVEPWLENMRFAAQEGARPSRELLATAGERLAIERVLWTGDSSEIEFEIEGIFVTEIEPDGRLRALIKFDPEDRAAAFAEMHARFLAGEGAGSAGLAPAAALAAALAARDWDRLRGLLADDFQMHDRRALSFGALSSEAWIESLKIEMDLAQDVGREIFQTLAWNGRGRVAMARRFGTLRDGGPFENVYVALTLTDGERIARYELFDTGDVERALARFEELCAGPPW